MVIKNEQMKTVISKCRKVYRIDFETLGIVSILKADNGSDHRAGTIILRAEKPARKPGFACITLLCGD